jgi:sugar diacid utilization regulator
LRVLRAPRPYGEILIVELGDAPHDRLVASLELPPGTRVGIGPVVDDPLALRHSARLAEVALRTCTEDREIAVLDARIPVGLVVGSPDLAAELAADALGAVFTTDPLESALLLEALTAWLNADGSAERAANRLFCHRNTVLKRLRRIEDLTGRSVARPRDLVELSLALDAYRVSLGAGRP